VHDALMIESSIDDIKAMADKTSQHMESASRIICGDLTIKTDVKFTSYPNRYEDGRGKIIWDLVNDYLKTNNARA
jgi:hypothetical protein